VLKPVTASCLPLVARRFIRKKLLRFALKSKGVKGATNFSSIHNSPMQYTWREIEPLVFSCKKIRRYLWVCAGDLSRVEMSPALGRFIRGLRGRDVDAHYSLHRRNMRTNSPAPTRGHTTGERGARPQGISEGDESLLLNLSSK
jgi:hypothetical protein